MIQLFVLIKGLVGEGNPGDPQYYGNPYNLIIIDPKYPGRHVLDVGEYASYAAAKTAAGNIFKASLTWDNTLANGTDPFTT